MSRIALRDWYQESTRMAIATGIVRIAFAHSRACACRWHLAAWHHRCARRKARLEAFALLTSKRRRKKHAFAMRVWLRRSNAVSAEMIVRHRSKRRRRERAIQIWRLVTRLGTARCSLLTAPERIMRSERPRLHPLLAEATETWRWTAIKMDELRYAAYRNRSTVAIRMFRVRCRRASQWADLHTRALATLVCRFLVGAISAWRVRADSLRVSNSLAAAANAHLLHVSWHTLRSNLRSMRTREEVWAPFKAVWRPHATRLLRRHALDVWVTRADEFRVRPFSPNGRLAYATIDHGHLTISMPSGSEDAVDSGAADAGNSYEGAFDEDEGIAGEDVVDGIPLTSFASVGDDEMRSATDGASVGLESESTARRQIGPRRGPNAARQSSVAAIAPAATPRTLSPQSSWQRRRQWAPSSSSRYVGHAGYTRAAWRHWKHVANSNSTMLRFSAICRLHRLAEAVDYQFSWWAASRERLAEENDRWEAGMAAYRQLQLRTLLRRWHSGAATWMQQRAYVHDQAIECVRMAMISWSRIAEGRRVSQLALVVAEERAVIGDSMRAMQTWKGDSPTAHPAWYQTPSPAPAHPLLPNPMWQATSRSTM